jgi:hypothetical protein
MFGREDNMTEPSLADLDKRVRRLMRMSIVSVVLLLIIEVPLLIVVLPEAVRVLRPSEFVPYPVPMAWIVAAHDLRAGRILQPGDIAHRENVGGEQVPTDRIDLSDARFIPGRALVNGIAAGSPIGILDLSGAIPESDWPKAYGSETDRVANKPAEDIGTNAPNLQR